MTYVTNIFNGLGETNHYRESYLVKSCLIRKFTLCGPLNILKKSHITIIIGAKVYCDAWLYPHIQIPVFGDFKCVLSKKLERSLELIIEHFPWRAEIPLNLYWPKGIMGDFRLRIDGNFKNEICVSATLDTTLVRPIQ